MLQIVVEQSSVDSTVEYVEWVKQRIFAQMRVGMQEAMEELAVEAVAQAMADGIESHTGGFFADIMNSVHVSENESLIHGEVEADQTLGFQARHLGLWLVEGTHVPAVKLSDTAQRRYFNKTGFANALHKAFSFTPSGGDSVVWASGHRAFTVRAHPFMHRAAEIYSDPIKEIINARVAEAYE